MLRLLSALVAALFLCVPARADYTAKDATGTPFTIKTITLPGVGLVPQHVPTDGNGVVYSASNPLFVRLHAGTALAGGFQLYGADGLTVAAVTGANALKIDGSAVVQPVAQTAGPWTVNLTQFAGAPPSAANPLPTQLSLGNAAVASANPLPIVCQSGCVSGTGETTIATYSAFADFANAAAATDYACITGSASKTIRVRRLYLSAFHGTGANGKFQLIRRSTANTGGTPTTLTAARHDTNDAAATATVVTYGSSPTLGTSAGVVGGFDLYSGTAPDRQEVKWAAADRGAKSIALRGAGESLCLAAASNIVFGNRLTWEWTEE